MSRGESVWTVPNAIGAARLLGCGPLLGCAATGRRGAFLSLLVILLVSDWIDGKLAVLLDQRTEVGARLDSLSDWVLYATAGLGLWWLEPETVLRVAPGVVAVALSWSLSQTVAWARFGRLASYHTRAAKVSWLVAACALVSVLTTEWTAPAWAALALATATNLEATAIGLLLPTWRADVRSFVHALRLRRRVERAAGSAHDLPGER